MKALDRRAWLRLTGMASALGLAWSGRKALAQAPSPSGDAYGTMEHAAHRSGPVGRASLETFNPSVFLRRLNELYCISLHKSQGQAIPECPRVPACTFTLKISKETRKGTF